MKKQFVKHLFYDFCFLFFFSFNFITLFSSKIETLPHPILVVVLMVKNEELVIVPTIKTMVDGGIRDYYIFDTGSTDKTRENAQNYFDQLKNEDKVSQYYIEQEPFIDFSTSRNMALERAKEKFPDAAFFLMPDAEWYLHNGEKLLEFCKEHVIEKEDDKPWYPVRIMGANIDFYTCRLIRGSLKAKFAGVVHETLIPGVNTKPVPEAYFELSVGRDGAEKTKKRWLRDRELLLTEYQNNPKDTRSLFYLAQTCQCLGDLEYSYAYLSRRVDMVGWPEEDFVARYRLGQILEERAKRKDEGFTWERAKEAYLKAHAFRPHRIEPLVRIAQHYIDEDNMYVAFIYGLRSVMYPYPKDDILFLEKAIYDFQRYEIISRCCWYIDQYRIGEWASRMALKARPGTAYLERNLKFYTDRKKTRGIGDPDSELDNDSVTITLAPV